MFCASYEMPSDFLCNIFDRDFRSYLQSLETLKPNRRNESYPMRFRRKTQPPGGIRQRFPQSRKKGNFTLNLLREWRR